MARIDIKSAQGQTVGQADLRDDIFAATVNEATLHATVVGQLAARRRGTAATLNRSKIEGGARKPWKQKGTGRARAGSSRSPIWRHGATTFGPQPRDHSIKVNKQVRAGALRSALSLKMQAGKLHLVRGLEFNPIKTKKAIETLKALGLKSALVVIEAANPGIERSFRNLPRCKVIRAEGLNVYDVLKHEGLVMTEAAMQKVTARLAAPSAEAGK